MRLRRRVAVPLAALLGAAAVASCGGSSASASGSASASITVGGFSAAPAVAPGFVGISTELKNLLVYAGTNPAALDKPFEQLLRNLSPTSPPVLRLGGDSSDWTWWPVPGMARPGGARYSLSTAWTNVAKALATGIGGKLIVGLNAEANSTRLAAYEAQQLETNLGPGTVSAFELGNEPELYSGFAWYKGHDGEPIYGRPHGYTLAQYAQDFEALSRGLSKYPIAGPSSGSPNWLPALSEFLAPQKHLSLVTIHAYPLKHCVASVVEHESDLFTTAALQGLGGEIAGYVRAAAAHHLPLRVDEMNAVSCGGELGLSNSFGPALWALNMLPQLVRSGAAGVNFHTVPHGWQGLINAAQRPGGWQVAVQPEYYGLLTFALAAPTGSHLLNVASSSTNGLYEWASESPTKQIHVVLTNISGSPRTVGVKIPQGNGPGTVVVLQASGLNATSGVTLGGDTLDPSTGALSGVPHEISVAPTKSVYSVRLPGTGAAVLTLSAR
jgi:hypothetical protein